MTYRFCNHRRKVPREIEEMHCFSQNVITLFREISLSCWVYFLLNSIIWKKINNALLHTILYPWFLAEGRWLPRNSGFCVLNHVFREIPEQSLWRVTLFRVDHRLSKSPSLSFIFRPLFCPPIPQHNAVWRTMGEKQGPGMHSISIFFLCLVPSVF